ncbi:hypothetical protein [Phocaeicola sp.]
MKQLIIIVLSCLLFSCDDDVYGGGTNPELNIETYTFGKEGGSIEVYSQIDYSLGFTYEPYWFEVEDVDAATPAEIEGGLDGGWYKMTYAAVPYRKRIIIEVQPNDTGKERIIPIRIVSGNYACKNEYTQAK